VEFGPPERRLRPASLPSARSRGGFPLRRGGSTWWRPGPARR
jgi:hypothetical protein